MTYLAHRDPESGREQSVLTHLQGTARLAADFAGAFGSAEEGRRCGMLHDIGKYSDAFQRRINGAPEAVDHSTAGAREESLDAEAFMKNGKVPRGDFPWR